MAIVKSLCVYCGASLGNSPNYFRLAQDLGRHMAEKGVRLVYGGGRIGLMGALADSVMAAGGRAIGIIPEHLQSAEVGHNGLSELKVVGSMHARKKLMFDLSDAFAVLPGGFGTLDETFEIVTWRQLGLHDKPIVLVDQDNYWGPFLELIDHIVSEGFARPMARQHFSVVNNISRLFDFLESEMETREPSFPERI